MTRKNNLWGLEVSGSQDNVVHQMKMQGRFVISIYSAENFSFGFLRAMKKVVFSGEQVFEVNFFSISKVCAINFFKPLSLFQDKHYRIEYE